MPTDRKAALAEHLRDLTSSFTKALSGRLEELQTAAKPILENAVGEDLRRSLDDVSKLSHKMVGSAAMFGFEEISSSARALGDLCGSLLIGDAVPSDEAKAEIRELLREMSDIASAGEAPTPTHSAAMNEGPTADENCALLIDDRSSEPAPTLTVLEEYGYTANVITDCDQALAAIAAGHTRAIFLSMSLTGWQAVCIKISQALRRDAKRRVPLICLSPRDDLDHRLAALRAGADGYLTEPLQLPMLKHEVEASSKQPLHEPYRVLIAESKAHLASLYTATFDGPGYVAHILKEPHRVLDYVKTFHPEVIVLDLALSGCSGLELARVIQQTEAGENAAILLLSPGAEFDRELFRWGLTNACFLRKPVDADSLGTNILRQAARIRKGEPDPAQSSLATALRDHRIYDALHRVLGQEPASLVATGGQEDVESAKTPTVLIVDDDPLIVKAISAKLEGDGLECLQAFGGEEGFDLAWKHSPDLIISDYQMPKGSADYLLSRLKGSARTKNIPALILTSQTVNGRKDYALEREMLGRLGAVSYLAKPIEWTVLMTEMRRHIAFPQEGETV